MSLSVLRSYISVYFSQLCMYIRLTLATSFRNPCNSAS